MDTNLLLSQRKFLVPKIVYGEGALELAGRHDMNFGATKALVVSDPGVMESGWTTQVETSLQKSNLNYIFFTAVTPNPKDLEVMAGTQLYLQEGCDLFIAAGGGSPVVCAKGIGVIATNAGFITDFSGGR